MRSNRRSTTDFDVAPDGERFIVLQEPEERADQDPADEGIVIVESRFEEFRDPSRR